MRSFILIGLFLYSICSASAQKASIQQGKVFVKLSVKAEKNNRALSIFDEAEILNFELVRKNAIQKTKLSILDGLYLVEVKSATNIVTFCEKLEQSSEILYAEPTYVEQQLYVPNDPSASNGDQDYLSVISATDAWDITRGSENIVIGIIDSGLDFTHEDIANKIYINEADPPNGIDDDNNGYVDDYRGYDFADEDSIAQNGISFHGNRVGGIAGAETDNEIGIAGVGFNTKIAALKNFKSENNLSNNSYEAIIYAADNGYDIINLSWGSIGTFSQAHQDIINYAAIEKNVVIVAAAGNTPDDLKFYPASYENVLSVAASNLDDSKAGFSTYNYSVDLVAPGNSIYSTFKDDGYASDNGTSYSSPMVAGAAALVKSIKPDLTAQQIMEILRVTTDEIYSNGSNRDFDGKLGSGRLNIEQALTQESLKTLRTTQFTIQNSFGTNPFPGDTLYLDLEMTSFLDPIENGTITFSSDNEFLELLAEPLSLGSIATLSNNSYQQLPVAILRENTPPESQLAIRMDYSDQDYNDFQYLEFQSSPNRIDIETESVTMTVAGNAGLGYEGNIFNNGRGFLFDGGQIASKMGFLIRVDSAISDFLPIAADNNVRDNDFISSSPMRLQNHHIFDIATFNMFEDSTRTEPLFVENRNFTDSSSSYIILEYLLGNTSADTFAIDQIGLYMDWDISAKFRNKSWYDLEEKLLISTNEDSSIWTGIFSFFRDSPYFLALDLSTQDGNGSDLESNSFADSTLINLLNQSSLDSAGKFGMGNDICNFLLDDSIQILPNNHSKSTFIMAAAETKEALFDQVQQAKSKYAVSLNQPVVLFSIISCEGASLEIHPGKSYDYTYYADAFGIDTIAISDTLTTGVITSDTTFYVTDNHKGYKSKVAAISVTLIDQVADFSLSTDTLYLDEDVNQVQLIDQSFQAISWSWNFGNGLQSTLQNPSVSYQNPGNYVITLSVENDLGCSGTISKNLVVAKRPPLPDIADQIICEGEDVLLTATNTQNLAFYRNEEDETPLLKASELTIPEVTSDTMIFVTNLENGFESRKLSVKIEIQNIVADFIIVPDTTMEQTSARLTSMTEMADSLRWFVDDQFLGSEPNLIFEVTKTDYTISLMAYSAFGCIDSLGRNYSFQQSPEPTLNLTPVCVGDIVNLKPENGQIFGFYKDETLQQLFKKGQNLILDSVQQDTSIYVVGLDSLLPSKPLRVDIIPIEFTFEITASTDTLFLIESLTASFNINTNNISEVTWHINDQFVESRPSPTLLFDSAGSYQVKCLATNLEGCNGMDTFSLIVLDERPEKPLSITASNDWLVYPNPNQGIFYVRSKTNSTYLISDLSGQIVQKGMLDRGVNQISCRSLQGIYFINVDDQRMAKIIIK